MFSAGADGTIRAWNVASVADSISLQMAETQFTYIDLSPDGETVLLHAVPNKSAYLFDARSGKPRGDPIELSQLVQSPDWSADGSRLIQPDGDKRILVLDARSGKITKTLECYPVLGWAAALSPDGNMCAHSGPDAVIIVRDIETGSRIRTIQGLEEGVHNLAFSRDGTLLAGADVNGWVKVWELATGRELSARQFDWMYIFRIRFSHDGRRLAIVGNNQRYLNGQAYVVDTRGNGKPLPLKGHTLNVTDVDFDPDGKRLATVGADLTIRVWELATGQEVLKVRGKDPFSLALRFLSKGQRIITAGPDRKIRYWDATLLAE